MVHRITLGAGGAGALWQECSAAGRRVHFRIPIFDKFYVQSTRLRVLITSRQTLMTRDGKTVTLSGMPGYSIVDVMMLHQTLYHAEDTLLFSDSELAISPFADLTRALFATRQSRSIVCWYLSC